MTVLGVVFSFLSPSLVSSQTLISSPKGPIEIIGLHRWTYRMLRDSLARYAPGEGLRSHACEANLEAKLKFPSASVVYYFEVTDINQEIPKPTIVITIVEPQDSARVRYRKLRAETAPSARLSQLRNTAFPKNIDVEDYSLLLQFYPIAQRFGIDSAEKALSNFSEKLKPQANLLYQKLTSYRQQEDLTEALTIVESNGSDQLRLAALGVLLNFPGDDRSWYALLQSARDPVKELRSVAIPVIRSFSLEYARPVNWVPVKEDLRWLLGGTNVSAFTSIVDVLNKTKIDPELSKFLLQGNADLIFAHAHAHFPGARTPARDLLRRLSGIDADETGKQWVSWYRSSLYDHRSKLKQ